MERLGSSPVGVVLLTAAPWSLERIIFTARRRPDRAFHRSQYI